MAVKKLPKTSPLPAKTGTAATPGQPQVQSANQTASAAWQTGYYAPLPNFGKASFPVYGGVGGGAIAPTPTPGQLHDPSLYNANGDLNIQKYFSAIGQTDPYATDSAASSGTTPTTMPSGASYTKPASWSDAQWQSWQNVYGHGGGQDLGLTAPAPATTDTLAGAGGTAPGVSGRREAVSNQLWFPGGAGAPAPGAATTPGSAPTPVGSNTAQPATYSPAYGGIPQLPDPTSTAGQAITGNQNNLASLYGLDVGTSNASAAGAAAQYGANLPQYGNLINQASSDIAAGLGGQVDTQTWNNLQQMAAERGIQMGSPGSPNANAALLSALGTTTYQREEQAMRDLNAAVARTPTGPQFNPATMQVTPSQQQGAAAGQALYNAAPIPGAAADAEMNAARAGMRYGQGAAAVPQAGMPSVPTTAPPTTDPRAGGYDPYAPGPATPSGGAWTYDSILGGWVNEQTGEIADVPGGQTWGVTASDLYGGMDTGTTTTPGAEDLVSQWDQEWNDLLGLSGGSEDFSMADNLGG